MHENLTKKQKLLKESIINFAKNELNTDLSYNDDKAIFARDNWIKCSRDIEILSLLCSEKYGGFNESLQNTLLALEALSYACRDSGLVHAIVTQLCCIVQLNLFADESLKNRYLPSLIKGEKIAAQAITEPDSGSDVPSMKTYAAENGDHYLINGSKTFISNGPVSDIILVYAGCQNKRNSFTKISTFLVEKKYKGFKSGEPLDKMGLRTMHNSELFFDSCKVPKSNLIGVEGQGMLIFNEMMEWERALMGAVHIGTLSRIVEKCIQYANTRMQFGKSIGKFQSISNKIAEMVVNLELGRSFLYKIAKHKDSNMRTAKDTSILKLFVSESLKSACLEAIQIHGGYGYMKDYELEMELRNSVASTIYSGTSEMQKKMIAYLAGVK